MPPTITEPSSEPSARARFTDVARDLLSGITSGQFPVGSLLPTELELCALYKTSRHTVRAALADLQEAGLVSRRKNVGTRVEAAAPRMGFQQAVASLEDLVQFGAAHVRQAPEIEVVKADPHLARLLGVKVEDSFLRISSLRMAPGPKGLPLGWTDVYVPTVYEGLEAHVRAAPDVLVSTLIERHYGRSAAEIVQEVHAIDASEAIARRLHMAPGTAALRIVRRYLDSSGAVLSTAVAVHPSDRFALITRLKRSVTTP